MLRKLSALTVALCAIAGLAATSAAADTVTAGNQIFSGKACFGAACVDPEAYSGLPIRAKTGDTPGLSLVQTNGSGFTPYNWDIAGNEANFFIRDQTSGSRLPFRIFPGALTNTLRANANSTVSTRGVFVEDNQGAQSPAVPAIDGANLLDAIASVSFNTFTLTGDAARHFQPTPASFNSALNLGATDSIVPADVSAVALAGVQELSTDLQTLTNKVNALPTTASPDAAANAKIAALTIANAKMLKSLTALQKKVKKLSKRK